MDENWYTNESVWSLSFFYPDPQEDKKKKKKKILHSSISEVPTLPSFSTREEFSTVVPFHVDLCIHTLGAVCLSIFAPKKFSWGLELAKSIWDTSTALSFAITPLSVAAQAAETFARDIIWAY